MTAQGTFDWRSLGKADYAQASALVSSLPEGIRIEIDGVAREILCRIIHLGWVRAQGSGTGAAFCYPKLLTLAKYVARSTRTAQRALVKLRRLGLVTWRHRMTKTGDNTSNLYQVGKTLLASLFARKGRKSPIKPATTKMSDNDLKREYKADVAPYVKPFVPPEWMMHRVAPTPSLQTTGSDNTAWDEEPKDPDAARKALLKQQAAALKARGL